MTENQLKYVRRILEREGISFMENDLALEFSGNRTDSLIFLSHRETQALIGSLIDKTPEEKMQGKILSLAHEMRWELPNGKVDMDRLNGWCRKHTPYHKYFNELTKDELPTVVSIFEKVYKSFLKAL